jgi:hypothetical protein
MGFGRADGPGGGEVKVAKLTAGRGCCWLSLGGQSTGLDFGRMALLRSMRVAAASALDRVVRSHDFKEPYALVRGWRTHSSPLSGTARIIAENGPFVKNKNGTKFS